MGVKTPPPPPILDSGLSRDASDTGHTGDGESNCSQSEEVCSTSSRSSIEEIKRRSIVVTTEQKTKVGYSQFSKK